MSFYTQGIGALLLFLVVSFLAVYLPYKVKTFLNKDLDKKEVLLEKVLVVAMAGIFIWSSSLLTYEPSGQNVAMAGEKPAVLARAGFPVQSVVYNSSASISGEKLAQAKKERQFDFYSNYIIWLALAFFLAPGLILIVKRLKINKNIAVVFCVLSAFLATLCGFFYLYPFFNQ